VSEKLYLDKIRMGKDMEDGHNYWKTAATII